MIGKKPKAKWPLWTALLPVVAVLASLAYLSVRTALFIFSDYAWYEKIVALLLLATEAFMIIHGIGYLLEIFHVLIKGGETRVETKPIPPAEQPVVAIIVSSYHEPLKVLEETLTCFYGLSYSKKVIYFLDDTRYDLPGSNPEEMADYKNAIDAMCRHFGIYLFRRKWHGAKAGMVNDFLSFLGDSFKDGFEFFNYGNSEYLGQEKYIAIFDADQNPMPNFIEPLVERMEVEPRLAFIQTPQCYTNFESNRVARASSLQQAVFYEYICEGKSLKEAMFCCGTNVLFRVEALADVGGFDESSVTEDFATSFKFHMRGWKSAYSSVVGVFGMGPEDLGAYFKQQFRWALGTIGLFRTLLGVFLKGPGKLSLAKWWEYFLSGSYYFVGFVYFVLMLCPPLYIYFKVPTYMAHPDIYLLLFFPYIIISISVFFITLQRRGYHFFEIFFGQLLVCVSFPVYLKAAVYGMLGVRGRFVVTPKGESNALPLAQLWPQISMALLNLGAVAWGAHRIFIEQEEIAATSVNMFWCLYHFSLLSSFLYFNNPKED